MTKKKSVFSQNLIKLRKQKGLSQTKLAELSGLTQRVITHYENNSSNPPIENIEAIAKVLGVSINKLLGSNDDKQKQHFFSQLDSRTISKLKLILSLPKEERHIVYSIAENFQAKRKLQQLQNSKP